MLRLHHRGHSLLAGHALQLRTKQRSTRYLDSASTRSVGCGRRENPRAARSRGCRALVVRRRLGHLLIQDVFTIVLAGFAAGERVGARLIATVNNQGSPSSGTAARLQLAGLLSQKECSVDHLVLSGIFQHIVAFIWSKTKGTGGPLLTALTL